MEENKTPVSPNPGQTMGLFLNTPKAFTGYTLFAPKHHTITYLIDNQGRSVHSGRAITSRASPSTFCPTAICCAPHVARCRGGTGGGEGGRLEEFDWDGNLVWEFDYSTSDHLLHHDVKPLPNGNVLVLMVEKKSYEQAMAAGFDPRSYATRIICFPIPSSRSNPSGPRAAASSGSGTSGTT